MFLILKKFLSDEGLCRNFIFDVGEIENFLMENPTYGKETTEELRQNIQAFFRTQNRCVTKEDYEARVLNIPSSFGSISKVFVSRNALDYLDTLAIQSQVDTIRSTLEKELNSNDFMKKL